MKPLRHFIFSTWKKDDVQEQIITAQSRALILVSVICIALIIGWTNAPRQMTVYIPPDLSNGATQKAGAISKTYVYSFAYQLWQEMNYWPQDGSHDYANNIQSYSAYLTPAFRSILLQDVEDLKTAGQLQRQRMVQGNSGAAFDSSLVKVLGPDAWEIDLTLRVTEFKNNELVKDVEILYPLKIVRQDVSRANNPYGLAIAGFITEPTRVKTYV